MSNSGKGVKWMGHVWKHTGSGKSIWKSIDTQSRLEGAVVEHHLNKIFYKKVFLSCLVFLCFVLISLQSNRFLSFH